MHALTGTFLYPKEIAAKSNFNRKFKVPVIVLHFPIEKKD
jgi:hypothetical protein